MDSFVNANLILLNVLGKKTNAVDEGTRGDGGRNVNRTNGRKVRKNFRFGDKAMLCLPKYRTKMSESKVIRSMSRFDMSGFWGKASMMDSIVAESEIVRLSADLSGKSLFRYGTNDEQDRMTFDCNLSDSMSIFIEKRLVENCTDYDILNNCSGIFLKWYYYMCLGSIPEFNDLRVENDDQRRTIVLAQMSQLALCVAADYVNLNYNTLSGIYFSIEIILMVALCSRMYKSEELDLDSMMDAVACRSFEFIRGVFNVRHIVDKSPTWVEYIECKDDDGIVISCEYNLISSRLDEDYTLFVNKKFRPSLKLKDWMIWNSKINRAILDSDATELELLMINLLSSINAVNLVFKPETLRRVKAVSKRMRLREFKLLELILDDMHSSHESQTVTTE